MKLRDLHLKTRITALILLLFLSAMWSMTLVLSHHLEKDMTELLESQQFTAAGDIARSIDGELKFRIKMLEATASKMTPGMLARPERIRTYLQNNPELYIPFSIGTVVLSNEGKVIADYPVLPGQAEASFTEREYFKNVIATNKPYIGTPRVGRFSKKPEVGFAVPILDPSGKRIAILVGFSDLEDQDLTGSIRGSVQHDFLDRVLLFSARDNIIVTGSDPSRTLTPVPPRGKNPLIDRFIDGFEGSGITNNLRGVRLFASAKKIPTAGWFVRVGVPTDIAFAPIYHMETIAFSIASGLSLLVGLLMWFVIKQSMKPLYDASSKIASMSASKELLKPLPVQRKDEIGQLITCFNMLVEERNQLEIALEKKANIDFLTGVHSRGYFMEQAETELARAKRYDAHLSVFMLDIDHFKQINDSHGHKSGDAVLRKMAEVCQKTLRAVDIIGRVGGEEFAIMLPETDRVEAIEVAERLRSAIAEAKVPVESGLPLRFTVSIGVASIFTKEDNVDVLLNHADKALYEAKNSGRNRVCVAEQ